MKRLRCAWRCGDNQFWANLDAYSTLMEIKRNCTDDPIAGLILWRAAHHILPGGIGGGSVVEYYFPE